MKEEIVSCVSKFITWIFGRNIGCFCISAILSIICYLYKKISLFELFLVFFLFFCLGVLLTSIVDRIKGVINKNLENKKEEKNIYSSYEKRIKEIVNILNNRDNIEKFKELVYRGCVIIRKEDEDQYNQFEYIILQQDVLVEKNYMADGTEYIVEKDYANIIKRFFKIHKNNYMEYVYSDFSDKKKEEKITEEDLEDNRLFNIIKRAFVEANEEINKPKKIPERILTKKEKKKILFDFWFKQKNLNPNSDFPFCALQSILGDIVVFVATVFLITFCILNIWVCVAVFLKYGICIKSIFVSIIVVLIIIGMYNIVCLLRCVRKTLSEYIYDKNLSVSLMSAFIAFLSLVVSIIAIAKG